MRTLLYLVGVLTVAITCSAQETNITIHGYRDGRLEFNEITNAAYYRVDWAPQAGGPWSQSWAQFQNVPPSGTNGHIALSLPKFYRVTAVLKGALSGLIAHFSFDEQSAGRIPDKACPGNYADVYGATWVASNAMGGAYSFDGTNDYIELGSTSLYQQRGQLSACAWIYRTTRHMFFMTNYRGGSAYSGQFEFVITGSGELAVSCGQQSDHLLYKATTPDIVPSNGWHHVAFTYDEARGNGNKIKLFLDGVKIEGITVLDEGNGTSILQTSDRLRLMMNNAPLPQYPWPSPGMIHEIMLFDRALSDAEVQQVYNLQ